MKQRQFLHVVDRDEAERLFREALGALPELGSERLPLDAALGRVLAEDVASAVDVPGFDRANLDGWAVRAADTFGASEHSPKRLVHAPTSVRIGALSTRALSAGEAMPIPTGGALPRGADAVLQVEHSELCAGKLDEVEVRRAITPGTAVTYAGTDIARGETMLRAGERVGSREVGVLAAMGRAEVAVRRRPRVAILSTGDELVAPGEPLAVGQVHDANAALIAAAVVEQGAVAHRLGIVPDDAAALRAALTDALASHDVVLLSGGTSKGPGDLSAEALADVLQPPGVVVHGVALKPGKPLCLAVSGHKPVVVLPGFPTSAIFTFHEFVAPLLRAMCGDAQKGERAATLRARLPRKVASDPGRTEYNLVHIVTDDAGERIAYPIGKGSGSVTTWAHADGYFIVPRHTEQLPSGAAVEVHPMTGLGPRPDDLVIIGSHCVGLDVIIGALRARGVHSKLVAVGSEAGLEAAKRGACDVAPIHLLDAASGVYNEPFMTDALELVRGYGRMQGVIYRRGDARFEGRDAAAAVGDATNLAMINRNRGSGTRALYDRLLQGREPPGHSIEASSHHAVAAAVEQSRADWGIAIDAVAVPRGLGFLPITEERFDFALPRRGRRRAAVAAFCDVLGDARVLAALRAKGFSA